LPTKTFRHSVAIYEALEELATNATEGFIFEGSLRSVVSSVDSVPDDYYQRARDLLGKLGCIRYLRTGRGKQPSIIQLNYKPTVELYNEYIISSHKPKKMGTSELINGRITDLLRRMDRLEADMRTLKGMLRQESNDDD
jgi:hypothetical protein